MDSITIRKPDDWHVHLRDGAMLKAVLPFTAKRFGRAIVMPNLSPNPILTTAELRAYHARIMEANTGSSFTPLMTYYLTDNSSAEDIRKGFEEGIASAVKLYPAGATTNSAQGVTGMSKVRGVLETMQEIGMPILIHGETLTYPDGAAVDPYDREKAFLDTTLPGLLKDFPGLKIVLEHATTKDAVDFIRSDTSGRLASTITLHHLMENRTDVAGSQKPAYLHCMPVIKDETNQKAIREAATSGEPYFFLGTDSAPHPMSAKERDLPPAGIFTSPAAIELYAHVFDEMGKLENLEAFASLNGAKFYGMEANTETITLKKDPWTIDSLVQVTNGDTIRPFAYSEDSAERITIKWRLA